MSRPLYRKLSSNIKQHLKVLKRVDIQCSWMKSLNNIKCKFLQVNLHFRYNSNQNINIINCINLQAGKLVNLQTTLNSYMVAHDLKSV